MSRASRFIAIVSAAAVALTVLVSVAPASSAATAASKKVIKLAPGETAKVRLATNASTGYAWSYKVSGDKSAISVSKGVYKPGESTGGMVGVPGRTVWTVTGKAPGTATITFTLTPPGGGAAAKTKKVVITVS